MLRCNENNFIFLLILHGINAHSRLTALKHKTKPDRKKHGLYMRYLIHCVVIAKLSSNTLGQLVGCEVGINSVTALVTWLLVRNKIWWNTYCLYVSGHCSFFRCWNYVSFFVIKWFQLWVHLPHALKSKLSREITNRKYQFCYTKILTTTWYKLLNPNKMLKLS
jgi:hypothetical protein